MTGKQAGVAQLAEHQPSKLRVAGSRPVSRSKTNQGVTASVVTPFFLVWTTSPTPAPTPAQEIDFHDLQEYLRALIYGTRLKTSSWPPPDT